MPEGPFGGFRLTNFGPFSRETKQELRDAWDRCEDNARDQTDVEICRTLKEWALTLIGDQKIRPKVESLQEINEGFCLFVSEAVLEDIPNNDEIDIIQVGGMGYNHCFVRYRGKYFDTELPTGTDDPTELPFFKRVKRTNITESNMSEMPSPDPDSFSARNRRKIRGRREQ